MVQWTTGSPLILDRIFEPNIVVRSLLEHHAMIVCLSVCLLARLPAYLSFFSRFHNKF